MLGVKEITERLLKLLPEEIGVICQYNSTEYVFVVCAYWHVGERCIAYQSFIELNGTDAEIETWASDIIKVKTAYEAERVIAGNCQAG